LTRILYLGLLIVAVGALLETAVWLSGRRGPSRGAPATTRGEPAATTPAPRPTLNTYAFVRDTNTWGPDSVPYDLARSYGADTVLFASNDPNLAAAVTAARSNHASYGIWVPEGDGPSNPPGYGRYVAILSRRYQPQILVVNIEARGKGNGRSRGWAWNREAARAVARDAPGVNVGVAILPNESDFNYRAWLLHGATVFLPEAFGANPRTDRYNPSAVVEAVAKRGVPESMIQPVLAPGQRYDGPASYYALDDLRPKEPRASTSAAP
jgi:hypothetical protein